MRSSFRSFRTISLSLALLLTLSAVTFASAKSSRAPTLQATEAATATPIDPEQKVALKIDTPYTSPLNADSMTYRYFTFKGKANALVNVTVNILTGNMAFHLKINNQSGEQIGSVEGGFITAVSTTLKLPQDGNYGIEIDKADPGSGDFAAGTFSIVVNDAPPAPTAAATAKP